MGNAMLPNLYNTNVNLPEIFLFTTKIKIYK